MAPIIFPPEFELSSRLPRLRKFECEIFSMKCKINIITTKLYGNPAAEADDVAFLYNLLKRN